MPYPRHLIFEKDVEEELKSFLLKWILDHRAERGEWEDQLVNWQADYDANPFKEGEKNTPIQGACKIIIPLTAIAVETNHAALMGTLFPVGQQFISIKGKQAPTQQFAPIYQRFTNDQFINHIRVREALEPAFLEIEKFGTGVSRAEYCHKVKYGMIDEGGVEREIQVVVENNVKIKSVPLNNFWMRFHENDAQAAQCVGELSRMTPSEVKQAIRDKLFYEDAWEKIEGSFRLDDSTDNEVASEQDLNENRTRSLPEELKIFELWLEFNVTGLEDEPPKEIQVFFCEDAQAIVGAFYNQHAQLRRPYNKGVYIAVEHRWPGVGICKQNDQFQLEVTVQHRQRIDNATIANMRMFKLAKMSGYGPNEPIFPGKMWFLDQMDDLDTIQLGEIYPSAYNNEQQTLLYSQQRVGVNENSLGMPQVGTPGTATSDIARLQEAKRKFDYVINNVKSFVLENAYDCLDLIKLYGYRKSYIEFNPLEKQVIDAIHQTPFESFRDSTLFDIQIIGAQTNKVLDRQNWTQIAGFLTQYYTQMMTLAQNAGNQQLMMIMLQKAVTGGTEAMKQILETFDIQNIDSILPVQELLNGSQGLSTGGPNTGATQSLPSGGMGGPPNVPQ